MLGEKPTRILREVLAPPFEHRSYFTPEIVESEAEILRFLADRVVFIGIPLFVSLVYHNYVKLLFLLS